MLGVEPMGVPQPSAFQFRAGKGGGGLYVKRGTPCWGRWRLGEWEGVKCWPLRRTPQGYLGLWLATGAASSGDNSGGSLSEFYYHSNEDVERYFI